MNTPNIDFMGKRIIAAVFSAVLILIAVVALAVNGLNLGLDFTGALRQLTDIRQVPPLIDELMQT